ncbi:MAG: GC-type dockerin domain-anchored protein [Planctomycetota bacterium]
MRRTVLMMSLLASTTTPVAFAGSPTIGPLAPDFDIWMYPPGSGSFAPAASLFSPGSLTGDPDRLGYYFLGFDVEDLLPAGGPWQVSSATLTVYLLNSSTFSPTDGVLYDPTYDARETYAGQPDADPGRPIELYGSMLQEELTYEDWELSGYPVFGGGGYQSLPMDFDENGDTRDVQDSVDAGFEVNPWAIATTTDTYSAGGTMRIADSALLIFDIDVSDPNINAYLMSGLEEGVIGFNVSSLHVAVQPGTGEDPEIYPRLGTLESFLLPDPSLTITVEPVSSGCGVADVTTDGTNPGDAGFGEPDSVVSVSDLTFFVEQWTNGSTSEADLTTDGTNPGDAGFGVPDGAVSVSDLTFFVEAWIAGCAG